MAVTTVTDPAPRAVRDDVIPPSRVLREVLRHYLEFKELIASGGDHIIRYSYEVMEEDGHRRKETIAFSFWDLHRGIKELAPRKREALYWNVIEDQKQRDVAKRMGITTVSVGQYVQNACEQLLKFHFNTPDGSNDE